MSFVTDALGKQFLMINTIPTAGENEHILGNHCHMKVKPDVKTELTPVTKVLSCHFFSKLASISC